MRIFLADKTLAENLSSGVGWVVQYTAQRSVTPSTIKHPPIGTGSAEMSIIYSGRMPIGISAVTASHYYLVTSPLGRRLDLARGGDQPRALSIPIWW